MSWRKRLFGPKRLRIDPFTLAEPWRRLVQDAQAADTQFREAVGRTRAGPLQDRLADIGQRVSTGVGECWQVGQAGHALSRARSRIDLAGLRRELADLAAPADPTASATSASIQARIDSAERMDATIAETRDRLRLLNARLDEAVTRAIELSVSTATGDELSSVGADLISITSEVEALRQALVAVEQLGIGE
jgi:hypothetical protein